MRRTVAAITCALLCLSVLPGTTARAPDAQAHITSGGAAGSGTLRFHLDFESASLSEAGQYISVGSKGTDSFSGAAGQPLLPCWAEMAVLPLGSEVLDVSLENFSYSERYLTRRVLPAPERLPLLPGLPAPRTFEGPEYSSDELFPRAELEHRVTTGRGDGGELECHLHLTVYPVRYAPLSGLLRELRQAELEVRYSASPVPLQRLDETTDILVISPPEFQSEMERYVDHKEELGFRVRSVNLTEVYDGSLFNVSPGRDDPERIKYFLKQAVENWTVRFAVLVGDVEKFPCRLASVADGYEGNLVPSDLYYGDLFKMGTLDFSDWDKDRDGRYAESSSSSLNPDGADLDPDISVGRLPASNLTQLAGMMNKTIAYALNTTSPAEWFQNVTLVGTDPFPGDPWNIAESELSLDRTAGYLTSFNVTKFYETRGTFSPTNIRNNLTRGTGFSFFSDHGSAGGVCYPGGGGVGLTSATASTLSNGPKLPLCFMDACDTHMIDTNDSVGEHHVLNPGGGAIASIGATRIAYGSYGPHAPQYNGGYLMVHAAEAFTCATVMPGTILDKVKRDYLTKVRVTDIADFKTMVEYILLGDPAVVLGGPGIEPVPDLAEKWADPGAGITFNITISNRALHPETLNLSATSAWNCTLSRASLELGMGRSENLSLTVRVDPEALALASAKCTLELVLMSSGLPLRLELRARANTVRGMDFSLLDTAPSAYPGGNFTLSYGFKNLGNIEENASVEVLCEEEDWPVERAEEGLAVPVRTTIRGELEVAAPARLPCGPYSFRARLMTASDLSREFGIDVRVLESFGIEVRMPERRAESGPEGASFTYALENTGNCRDDCALSLDGLPPGWEASLAPGHSLPAYGNLTSSLVIWPPPEALAGDHQLRLGFAPASGFWKRSLGLTVVVGRVSELGLRALDDGMEVPAGSDASFGLVLSSGSNFRQDVEAEVSGLPEGWSWSCSPPGLEIAPFSNLTFTVTVRAAEGARAGAFPFMICARTDGWNASAVLSVQVERASAFTASADRSRQVLTPGNSTCFTITVANRGNSADRYTLALEGCPSASLSTRLLELGPGETGQAELRVEAPVGIGPGQWALKVIMSSASDPSAGRDLGFLVDVERVTHLDVQGGQRSTTEAGSGGEFTINVSNLGNAAEAVGLSLAEVPLLPVHWEGVTVQPGETGRMVVSYDVPAGAAPGNYTLRFIASTDSASWSIEHAITVPEPPLPPKDPEPVMSSGTILLPLAAVLALVLAVMVSAFGADILRRRRRAS